MDFVFVREMNDVEFLFIFYIQKYNSEQKF